MEFVGLIIAVTILLTIIVAPSVAIGLVANWLINGPKRTSHDELQAIINAHYGRVTGSMSNLCDRLDALEATPEPEPEPEPEFVPVAEESNDNEELFDECVQALIALGTPKRQAKSVARNSFNRKVPATVEEFVRQTLIKPVRAS